MHTCFRFVDHIADDLQDEVRSRIDGSRYLSVMVDAAVLMGHATCLQWLMQPY